jgi:DNA polymerase III subunit beta
MNFKLSKKELLNSLQKINRVIPTRSTLPILSCVLFDIKKNSLFLRGTDLEQTILIKININSSSEGKLAIPVKTLLEITQEIPDENLSININPENKVEIKTDFGKYSIMGKTTNEFPDMPNVENPVIIKMDKNELNDIIQDTLYATSRDEMKISLQGVCINVEKKQITAVATDGFRLVKRISKTKEENTYNGQVIIPNKFLTILQSHLTNDDLKLILCSNHIQIDNGNTTLVSRIIREKYPDYESIIPSDNDKIAVLNKNELLSAVKRVSIFSNRTTRQIALTFENNNTIITTEDPENITTGHEKIVCEYKEEPITIGFNANYLKEMLTHQSTEEVFIKLKSSLGAGMIIPKDDKAEREILSLLMPIRI